MPSTIDEYIARFPRDVQLTLKRLKATIKKAAPEAKETISYQIPAFVLEGSLVYFAAFKRHVGFYPRTTAITKFKKELAPYALSRGTVRFPFDEPVPFPLITRMVKFRARENLKEFRAKQERIKRRRSPKGRKG